MEHVEHDPVKQDTLHLLLLEDDELQTAIYKKKFDTWGLPIATTYCEFGFEAFLKFTDRKFDILLADIVMEGMDGLEMARNVRASPAFSDTRVALVSSLSSEGLDEKGGLPDGVTFFPKPIDYDALRSFLSEVCQQKLGN